VRQAMPGAQICSAMLLVIGTLLAVATKTEDVASPAEAPGGSAAAAPPRDTGHEVLGSADVFVANASDPLWGHFTQFVADFGKRYSPGEVGKRFAAFKESFLAIQACNAQNYTFTCGLNEHADITHEEFVRTHLGEDPSLEDEGEARAETPSPSAVEAPAVGSSDSLPSVVDWIQKGVVTPVLNQGGCGSCWAFAATAAMSSAWAIKTNSLVQLSQQQLLDCSPGSCRGWLAK